MSVKILDKKIGRFGWEIFLVQDGEGYKIGLMDSLGDLYQIYGEYDNLEIARYNWEKS